LGPRPDRASAVPEGRRDWIPKVQPAPGAKAIEEGLRFLGSRAAERAAAESRDGGR